MKGSIVGGNKIDKINENIYLINVPYIINQFWLEIHKYYIIVFNSCKK